MANIQDMNLAELDAFLKRKDITDEQRAEAMVRMNDITRSDETSREQPMPRKLPKSSPRRAQGQPVARGGKIKGYAYGTGKGGVKACRGRKAQGNKD